MTGKARETDGTATGSIEGMVNGEVFTWQWTDVSMRFLSGNVPNKSYRGEATIALDEMNGRADGPACPCTFVLRRVGGDPGQKKAQ